MASNHIEIGTETRLAREVRSFVDSAQALTDKARELQAEMAEFAQDWAALAAALNLTSEAEAQAVYDNILAAKQVLAGPNPGNNYGFTDFGYMLNRMS